MVGVGRAVSPAFVRTLRCQKLTAFKSPFSLHPVVLLSCGLPSRWPATQKSCSGSSARGLNTNTSKPQSSSGRQRAEGCRSKGKILGAVQEKPSQPGTCQWTRGKCRGSDSKGHQPPSTCSPSFEISLCCCHSSHSWCNFCCRPVPCPAAWSRDALLSPGSLQRGRAVPPALAAAASLPKSDLTVLLCLPLHYTYLVPPVMAPKVLQPMEKQLEGSALSHSSCLDLDTSSTA